MAFALRPQCERQLWMDLFCVLCVFCGSFLICVNLRNLWMDSGGQEAAIDSQGEGVEHAGGVAEQKTNHRSDILAFGKSA